MWADAREKNETDRPPTQPDTVVTLDEPDRLPAGVTLPNGRTLTYPASRDCGCADCLAAYEAHQDGELRRPEDGGLPW